MEALWEGGEHSKAAQMEKLLGYSGKLLPVDAVLKQLLVSGCFASLQMYAVGRGMQVAALTTAMAMEQLTMADKLASTWKLHSAFPNLHRQVHEYRLRKLCSRGKMHQAHALCGTSKEHLAFFLEHLVALGNYSVAREFKAKTSGIDVAIPEGEDKREDEGHHLDLACGADNVHLVTDPDGLQRLLVAVMAQTSTGTGFGSFSATIGGGNGFNVIGLDAEWKPVFTRGVRLVSRSISPQWGSIRFRLALRTYAPWGCIVRVGSLTKSGKIPTQKILPLLCVIRPSSGPWRCCRYAS